MPASQSMVGASSTGRVLLVDFMYYTYMRVRTSLSMSRSTELPSRQRSTQAERRARSRAALLESAARGLSRHGYGNLVLEHVAREAGYTRGALYHQFKDKEELALAVLEWVNETWWREVGTPAEQEPDPVAALLALARGHAVYCRRDVARVMMALRVEFSGQDHPVGREIKRVSETLVKRSVRLINAGRRDGSIPPGPPARAVALAFWGALEGAVIALAGQAPNDELLAARAVAGVLGLDSPPAPPSSDLAPRAPGARRSVSRMPPHAPGRSDQLH
jgi:AcrR family transcriptional regulator